MNCSLIQEPNVQKRVLLLYNESRISVASRVVLMGLIRGEGGVEYVSVRQEAAIH